MPSIGLNGRPILILDEKEAQCVELMFEHMENAGFSSGNPHYISFRQKVIDFNREAKSTVTQPTFVELMTQKEPHATELPHPTGEDRAAGCFGPATPVVDSAEPRRYA
jgi:hypothetical protein